MTDLSRLQLQRCVLCAHHRGNAQLAGHYGGVARASAAVGDDRRCGLHHRLPVRGGDVGDQDLARDEVREVRRGADEPGLAGRDLLAHRPTHRGDLAATSQGVRLQHGRLALRRDGLGSGLDDVELAVDPVLGPLDVHGSPVVVLDREGAARELEHVLVAQAVVDAIVLGRRNIARGLLVPVLGEDHLDRLVADGTAQDGTVPLAIGGLVHVKLVGVHRALDHVLAEPVGTGDEHDVGEAGLRVQGERHPGGRQVRAHHLHHADREGDVEVVDALFDPVVDGPVGEQAGKASTAGVEQALVPAHVEKGLLLAGEARGGQVLRRGRAPHGEADLVAVLIEQHLAAGQDLTGHRLGEPGGVDDRPGVLAPSP